MNGQIEEIFKFIGRTLVNWVGLAVLILLIVALFWIMSHFKMALARYISNRIGLTDEQTRKLANLIAQLFSFAAAIGVVLYIVLRS
jgi:uncharacterized membrane protein YozB (DUF420 family)